ncbi:MAG: 50S ribosomal protein L21, partial [Pirellulales bacterium]|nr:50S ribosomal protein L21 [Pirellulales bacterium]
MYAVIAHDGRQYKVEEGQELEIDFTDQPKGETVTFDKVLAYGDGTDTRIGRPTLDGASVTAEVLGIAQGPKFDVQKIRRRKNSRRKTGHRQMYTRVRVSKI